MLTESVLRFPLFVSHTQRCCPDCTKSGNNYFWKRWRGLPWTRPSAAAAWGHDFEGGWGPFEMVDMANAMGVEAVITTFAVGDVQDQTDHGTRPITPGDMADLVEYSFGGADTAWGKKRIEEDHHPAIYNWSYIELGNEQYNPTFVEQVAAMEKRAAEVGVAGKLHYLFPSGWNAKPQGVNATDAPKAAALQLGDRLLCDLHVTVWGHDGPVEPQLDGDGSISSVGGVARFQNVLTSPTTGPQGWGAMNLETNCGDHTFRRALEEAFDLNTYANEGNPRLKGRGASFCMERSGYQEAGLNDQGLIFFLPNVRSSTCPSFCCCSILPAHLSSRSSVQPYVRNAGNLGSATVLCPRDDCKYIAAKRLSSQHEEQRQLSCQREGSCVRTGQR